METLKENKLSSDESVIELKINLKSIKAEGATLSEKFFNESKNTEDALLSNIYLGFSKYLEGLESKQDEKSINFLACISSSENCITTTYGCGSCSSKDQRRRITNCSNGEHVDECIDC